ncbi:MAG: hypothetical protein KKG93_19325 [Bacteroidetes bacterium]|nr:hypothetical protein [Bacteroidota bacterium]
MNRKSLIIVFLLIVGCKENESINQSTEIYNFFPLAKGNQWSYKDSINAVVSNPVTTVIFSSIDSIGRLWWNINNQSFATEFLGPRFTIKNDSIFSLQSWRGGQEYLGLLLVPPNDTNFVFARACGDVIFEIQVTIGKKPYQVPAGSFNNWASYVLKGVLEIDSVIIAPGVGILGRTYIGLEYPGKPAFQNSSVLLTYHLN